MVKSFHIENILQGKNGLLFDSLGESVFYEKLSNTIHSGARFNLKKLYDEVEEVSYNPKYESDSLKKQEKDKMDGLILNLTDSCNLRCSYCSFSGSYENERSHGNTSMNYETAIKGINLFMPNASDPALISFYGGEPLNKNKLLEDIILYSKEKYPDKNIKFSMTSNFYDADKHVKTIVDNEIFVLVSLDGPKNVHDKYRIHKNGKPTWDKIISNLELIEKYSPGYIKNHIGLSVTCADPNDLGEINDFFKNKSEHNIFRIGGIERKGLKENKINELDPFLIDNFATEFLEYVDKREKIPDVYRLLFDEKLKSITQRDRQVMPEELNLSGACYPGQRKLFVETNGEFYMCEKFGGRVPIGNVNTGIEKQLVENSVDKFKEIRDELCSDDCWAQRLCAPCIQSAKDVTGDISKDGLQRTCTSSKTDTLISLALYSQILKNNKDFIEQYNLPELNKKEVKK